MSITEPGKMEIALILFQSKLVSKSRYRVFVERMDLSGSEKVLDFGAGWGENTRYLAMRLDKGGEVTALDISVKWQEVARRRLSAFTNVTYVNSDIRSSGLPKDRFDVIVISNVLHDIPKSERAEVTRELVNRLVSGGSIYLRERTGRNHGMPIEEIRLLMKECGMEESFSKAGRNTFLATYRKRTLPPGKKRDTGAPSRRESGPW